MFFLCLVVWPTLVELMFYVLSLSYFSVCCIDAVFIRVELDHFDVMGRVLATKS